MRELTVEELQGIEGGDWVDFLKGAACAGAITAAVYFTGPVGAVWAVRSGAVAACIVMLAT